MLKVQIDVGVGTSYACYAKEAKQTCHASYSGKRNMFAGHRVGYILAGMHSLIGEPVLFLTMATWGSLQEALLGARKVCRTMRKTFGQIE